MRALPVAETYAALQAEDPQRAAQLHPNDTLRVARALEVGLPEAVREMKRLMREARLR